MKKRPAYASISIEVFSSTVLSVFAIRYYAFLCYCSGPLGKSKPTWYANAAVSRLLSVSIRTVQRAKKELEDIGLIRIESLGKGGVNRVHLVDISPNICQRLLPTIWGRYDRQAQGYDKNVRAEDPDSLYIKHIKKQHQLAEETSPSEKPKQKPKERKRGKILDSVDRANVLSDKLARKKKARKVAKRLEGKIGIERRHDQNIHMKHIRKWGGARFYEHLIHLCGLHDVEISDTTTTKKPSHALTGTMEIAIKEFHKYGADNEKIYKLLEWLVINWNDLRSRFGSEKPPVSVFIIRYWTARIYRLYEDKANLKKSRKPRASDLPKFKL